MDSQPQSPNRRHHLGPQNHKQQRNMDKLRKAVLGAMALDSTTPLSEEMKNSIEMRLLQLFPIIRTPDHPPYAAMILKAIKTLNEERGSNEKSMSAFIESNYQVPWAHSSYLSHHLCKLVQNGDIVVTSDDHYMIPTENPSPKPKPMPKEKRQKRNRRQGRGGHLGDYYHGEAVVEEENPVRELELVETKESSQPQEHENYVIDEKKEQDAQVNEGKDQSLQLQNEEDRAALMIMPVESPSHRVEDKGEETVEELQNQPKSCMTLFGSQTPLNPQDYLETRLPESQHQDTDSIPERHKDTLPLGPPEHTPPRRGRGRPPKTVRDTITRDEASLPLQLEFYQQHPPESLLPLGPPERTRTRGRGRGRGRPPKTIPDPITRDEASLPLQHESYQQPPHLPQPLFPLGPPDHTRKPPRGRGRGRPPQTMPDTITRDESPLPLQHESYQQHPPPCRRGRGRPPKTTLYSITRDEASLPLQHESYQLHTPQSLLPFGHPEYTPSHPRGRGRPPKTKPDTITRDEASLPLQHEAYQLHTAQKRGRGRPRKSKPDVETTGGDLLPFRIENEEDLGS